MSADTRVKISMRVSSPVEIDRRVKSNPKQAVSHDHLHVIRRAALKAKFHANKLSGVKDTYFYIFKKPGVWV